jgi:hypothetical protein
MPVLKTPLLMLVLTLVADVYSSRILGVFPHPGLSHYKFFKPIMSGLAEAGHEVVVVSYFPDTKSSSDNYVDLALTNTEEILTEIVDLEVRGHFLVRKFKFLCNSSHSRYSMSHQYLTTTSHFLSYTNGVLTFVISAFILALWTKSFADTRLRLLT